MKSLNLQGNQKKSSISKSKDINSQNQNILKYIINGDIIKKHPCLRFFIIQKYKMK